MQYAETAVFQFTPLREGRLFSVAVEMKIVEISIHAPPRGATFFSDQNSLTVFISIHAPPRGATHASAPPEYAGAISIHAPPRGATGNPYTPLIRQKYFNSRPSARGDARWRSGTPPPSDFNSRPSARGDERRDPAAFDHWMISIHAPPRGATTCPWASTARRTYFNSRPSARGDQPSRRLLVIFPISIHAPPRGATGAQPSGGRP